MSANLKTLLTTAAEMRASGHPWETIARRVNRNTKTCRGWPQVHAALWQAIYREVQLQRHDQLVQECRDRLHALCRHDDLKVQQRAVEFVVKYSVQAYGRQGDIAPPAPEDPKDDAPAGPDARLAADANFDMRTSRARLDQERARQGLPAATTDEFLDHYLREKEEQARRAPIPVDFDADGNAVAPPGPDGGDPSRSKRTSAIDRSAGTTMMCGMFVVAALLAFRWEPANGPPAPAAADRPAIELQRFALARTDPAPGSRPRGERTAGHRSPPVPGPCHPSIIAESFDRTGAVTMADQKGKGAATAARDDKKITPRAEDYSQWYLDIVRRAELAENSDVRGCMVIKPNGYALWENMQRAIDGLFKATGHVNAYFPLFIPKSFFQKEEQMAEGFAKECAVVTHYRLTSKDGKIEVDPEAKLEEELIVRPTSETIIWNTYRGWIQSYRDLPLLINQWCNVVRWEMRTRLFLRTSEFLWQEGHTAHATQQEAEAETLQMVNVYRQFAEEWMAMPVLVGPKSEGQKFPGAVYTLCIEALMQDGKALQAGTSHFLGQNFSKAFDVQFTSEEGKREFAWATSWGASTRLIGGLLMTHSDDNGFVVPPRLAPTHVVICPMGRNDEERAPCIAAAEKLEAAITALPRDDFYGYQPLRVKIDRDFKNMPGHRFAEWELRGVPVRVEIGPKDIEKSACVVARRDVPGKEGKTMGIPLDAAPQKVDALLREIQKNLFERAKKFRDGSMRTANSYDEFKKMIEEPGFVWAHWDGTRATEDRIQEETKATIRVIPFDGPKEPGQCMVTGQPSERRVVFARAY